MPAEWAPHSATWVVWPHAPEIWPDPFDTVQEAFGCLVSSIGQFEPVHLIAQNGEVATAAQPFVDQQGPVRFPVQLHFMSTDDTWVRDSGPTFLVSESSDSPLAAVHWRFNAWGGKFPHLQDAAVGAAIARAAGALLFEAGLVLEGGSIDVDGDGTLLTTEQCLGHSNRNPSLARGDIEQSLSDYLGVERIIWLGEGLEGDDTDGHVDDVARFVAPGKVVLATCADAADANAKVLKDNRRRLELARDARGRRLEIIPLPSPDPMWLADRRLPASYANFYLVNEGVLLPVFGCPQDEEALAIFRRLFPRRTVVGMSARSLLGGGGSIHCLTQQQPRVR